MTPPACVALSVWIDPFITTACLRRGACNGMTRRDWTIFFISFVIANGWRVLATGQGPGVGTGFGHFLRLLQLDFLGEGAAKQVLESVQFAFGRAVLLLAAAVWLFRSRPVSQVTVPG